MLHARFVSLVALSVVALVACMEVEQPLGDAPSDEQGGTAGTTGGSGSTGGSGGTTGGSGGAAASGAAGRLPMAGNAGTLSSGGATASGGSGNDTGDAGEATTGGTGGTNPDCFSPDNPDGALSGGQGCPCGAADEAQCLRVLEGERPHLVALMCLDGAWASVEDGPCEVTRGCLVDNRVYPGDGNNGFPSPFDTCNHCGCDSGGLSCTEIGCDRVTCPAGTVPGSTCFECGPAGGCAIMEYGCVPACDEEGGCGASGVCRNDGICDLGCD